jgi:Trypsin-co-occurring domain 2
MSENTAVGLADAIASLRQELTAAMLEGRGEELQFKLGPIELEVQLQVENKGSLNGGVKWLLVSIGGAAERSVVQTHQLKLTLQPVGGQAGDAPSSTSGEGA